MTAPGSLAWLAVCDMRLGLRGLAGAMGGSLSVRVCILLLGAFGALLLLVRPVGRWIAAAAGDPAQAAALDGAMAMGAVIVLPWIASHALTGATRALYGRGDLDLLLTSPLPPRRILAARAVAIFLEATTAVGVFLAPVIISAIWFGGARWLALAPTLAGLGMIGSAAGLALALALFAIAGPRRTRQIAHVVAMLIGMSFVALLQALSFLPQEFDARLAMIGQSAEAGSLIASGALWAPAKAAQGDIGALLMLLLAGAGGLLAVCALLGGAFVRAALTAAGAPAPAPRVSGWARVRYTGSYGAALRRKEWKLLARDPWLTGHLLMQAIYTLPIAGALWRLQPINDGVVFILGPTLVLVMAQLSAALAWVAVSSEEAQDLMASAPISEAEQRRRKLEALAAPVLALLAPALVWLIWISPVQGLVMAGFALAAGASTALVNTWRPQPGKRSAILRRYSQSKLIALVEHLLAILWAMAAIFYIQEKSVWMAMAFLGLLTLWLARPAGARERVAERPASN